MGSGTLLRSHLRDSRKRSGLSQQALAERVGITRQAVIALEAGRQVPSTAVALQLARALGVRVEDLFSLPADDELEVELPLARRDLPGAGIESTRVSLGRVAGRWVAHRLEEATVAADGVVVSAGPRGARVRPLLDCEQLESNVLVAGCAPLLGALSQRVGSRHTDARVTWLAASSRRALELLATRAVHAAGVHLGEGQSLKRHLTKVRRAYPGENLLVVNLTRWRQGLVLQPGNPLCIRGPEDLLRPGLRFAHREDGAGARALLTRLLAADAGDLTRKLPGPLAPGHLEVGRFVRYGAADAGVAIENVALAAGLGFVPLSEERFDLIIPASIASHGPVNRLIGCLDDPAFRLEAGQLPGYDCSQAGQVTTLDAA